MGNAAALGGLEDRSCQLARLHGLRRLGGRWETDNVIGQELSYSFLHRVGLCGSDKLVVLFALVTEGHGKVTSESRPGQGQFAIDVIGSQRVPPEK